MGSGIKPGSGSKPSQEVFVFLCPNGHKLNGPPSLKGKLGQCPHCVAKFRIPDDDPDVVEGAELVDEPPPETDAVEEISPTNWKLRSRSRPLTKERIRWRIHRPALAAKGESGELEILLPEGEIMQPEHFSPSLSVATTGSLQRVREAAIPSALSPGPTSAA